MKDSICLLLFGLVMASCQSRNAQDQLVGTWLMDKVYEYDKDVTEKHNPNNDRWIEFKSDGTFISDGQPFGYNKGRWRVENEQSILYLDSDVDDDDSEWKISFNDDKTIWTGIGHLRKENTKLVHRRK